MNLEVWIVTNLVETKLLTMINTHSHVKTLKKAVARTNILTRSKEMADRQFPLFYVKEGNSLSTFKICFFKKVPSLEITIE